MEVRTSDSRSNCSLEIDKLMDDWMILPVGVCGDGIACAVSSNVQPQIFFGRVREWPECCLRSSFSGLKMILKY